MTAPAHKCGDTFDRSGPVTVTVDGVEVADLTGWSGRCQIRTPSGYLIAEPVFTWLDATLRLCRVRVPNTPGTLDWPEGAAVIDIEFTSPSGDRVSTNTARFEILRDVTRAAG